MNEARIAVFSTSWTRAPQRETVVAVRSIAGALSRLVAVDIFVPGAGARFGDGAFDPTPILDAPRSRAPYRAVIVEGGDHGDGGDGGDGDVAERIASLAGGAPVLSVGAPVLSVGAAANAVDAVDGVLDVGLGEPDARLDATPPVHAVGLYVRVHPGAIARRHYGLGTVTEYVLVLGDRGGVPTTASPSDRARWLLARFPRRHVVVLEGGVARVWRSRSCVAQFEVHTRMDLWILMAQASTVVDLRPGDLFARECVESLRYGVPVVVPDGSAADGLAQAAGGMRFSSTAELLSCVDALSDPATRTSLAVAGHKVVDRWYGDPRGLVDRLALALDLPRSTPAGPG